MCLLKEDVLALVTEHATTKEATAINAIRTLSMDAVQKANSGHPGLPMGAAPIGYVLFQDYLHYNPKDPKWPNRDRFVLSAGHGSMLLYSLLYLTGYDVSLDDLKNFRQLFSKTPGHPERTHTPGVEVTTGPLGQGFANGVGMAVAEAFLAATYNRPGHELIDHYTYALVSDGDIMEGISFEAASIAATLKLGKLIYYYDQNHITLAATADMSMREDVQARFDALGWHTQAINGMDTGEIRQATEAAQAVTDKPSLILCHTIIGYGAPHKENTFGVHGSPLGPDEVIAAKKNLGIPTEPPFYVPDDTLAQFRQAIDRGAKEQSDWEDKLKAYEKEFPKEAAELKMVLANELPDGWDSDIPSWQPDDKPIATRKASSEVMNSFYQKLPTFMGGSADLNPSTNTVLKGGGDFQNPATISDDEQGTSGGGWSYAGRNVHFGIREHGMAGIVNGMAAHGGIIPYGSSFLVFTDYCRPSIRLSALSKLHSLWVFTHDSVAVGEDGPTHEPVEQVMSLRAIPDLNVLRPADANETADAWRIAIEARTATMLVLTRQDLPILDRSRAKGGVRQGAYILSDTDGQPDVVLLATGSEVSLSVMARDLLKEKGVNARVVSMPSWELFAQRPEDYQASVLGPKGIARVSVEAGTTLGWQKYTGDNGAQVGIDTYGQSAPGKEVLKYYGFTREHVAATALRLLGKTDEADELDKDFRDGQAAGEQPSGSEGHS